MAIVVRVQGADFDAGAELAALRLGRPAIGAIASFVGSVRDVGAVTDPAFAPASAPPAVAGSLTLEHYPGMTERALHDICAAACERWAVGDLLVVHRIGALAPTEQIVLVAVSSAHRADAFDACRYVMDHLKTDAPFWKKETTPAGARWVEARADDHAAAARWHAAATDGSAR